MLQQIRITLSSFFEKRLEIDAIISFQLHFLFLFGKLLQNY